MRRLVLLAVVLFVVGCEAGGAEKTATQTAAQAAAPTGDDGSSGKDLSAEIEALRSALEDAQAKQLELQSQFNDLESEVARFRIGDDWREVVDSVESEMSDLETEVSGMDLALGEIESAVTALESSS